jgi:hypothetical protein
MSRPTNRLESMLMSYGYRMIDWAERSSLVGVMPWENRT